MQYEWQKRRERPRSDPATAAGKIFKQTTSHSVFLSTNVKKSRVETDRDTRINSCTRPYQWIFYCRYEYRCWYHTYCLVQFHRRCSSPSAVIGEKGWMRYSKEIEVSRSELARQEAHAHQSHLCCVCLQRNSCMEMKAEHSLSSVLTYNIRFKHMWGIIFHTSKMT